MSHRSQEEPRVTNQCQSRGYSEEIRVRISLPQGGDEVIGAEQQSCPFRDFSLTQEGTMLEKKEAVVKT